jgi:two-component system, OmpR family, response regulator RegX3
MKSPNSNGNGSELLANGVPLILSVDDEPAILATREAILESEGYAVLSAADGDQALSFFIANQIDLVLLDYVMPGMNGGIVCREMKKAKPYVPVMMVSANIVDGDTLKLVDHFISKGGSPRLLLEKVRELLTQNTMRDTVVQPDKRRANP